MASLRVVYHQWGFVQEKKLPPNSIEDCVDTLCVPGAALFPGGGRFEVWSLPKILGTTSGGVLWCRDKKTADFIRKIRDGHGSGLLPWIIRLLGHSSHQAHLYWQGVEASGGAISRLQTGEILSAIQRWDALVADRMEKMRQVIPLSFDWLPRQSDRLPPVVPLPPQIPNVDAKAAGVSSGHRIFERVDANGSRTLETVLPLPVHQDVSRRWLGDMLTAVGEAGTK
jgi:putative PLP-dependent aminotransferase (TIGR04422 family)